MTASSHPNSGCVGLDITAPTVASSEKRAVTLLQWRARTRLLPSAVQQRAGDPGGGGDALGSNGSRFAPQLGNVRGACAFPPVGDVVVVDFEIVDTVWAPEDDGVAGAADP